MSSRRSFSCLQINILNVSMGGNSLQSETEDEGSHIFPANHQQPLLWSIYQTSGHSSYFSGANTGHEPIERRVEAQTRIRRKLDEACANAGSIFDIDIVAQLAMDILSLVERKPSAFDVPLVNLAMDAHAMAYIALILCLYGFDENGKRKISRRNVRKLRRLLISVRKLLAMEARKTGIFTKIKRAFTKSRRRNRTALKHRQLRDILCDIERNENADILQSLNAALDCPCQ